jgi:small subunit ribosomal protein S31
MIRWTEEGKLWKFPINNEQGWEEEIETDFSEHVLLEMHLEGWCPESGPVRHFMELVCVGLSKNHYYSAKEKKDHIMWYQSYFEEKKELLGDLMTMGKGSTPVLGQEGGKQTQAEV